MSLIVELLKSLKACFGILCLAFHTLLTGISIFLLTPLKLILKIFGKDDLIVGLMRWPFHLWYRTIHWWFRGLTKARFELVLEGEEIPKDESSLLIANHQSWLDICVILSALKNHIPSATFFLKKELLYVPFIGSSAWAMDMIFVNRYSKSFLERYPHRKGEDLKNAIEKCKKLKDYPNSVVNFVEGTRYTREKFKKTNSTFKHLLPAKAGGVSFSLNSMQGKLKTLLSVSVIYGNGIKSNVVWRFLRGDINKVHVRVKSYSIKPDLYGDYQNDLEYRSFFQNYLNEIWQENDQYINSYLHPHKIEQPPHQ